MISPTWGFPPRRRQRWGESRLFSRPSGAPACAIADRRDSAEPRPCGDDTDASQGDASASTRPAELVLSSELRCHAKSVTCSGGLMPGFHENRADAAQPESRSRPRVPVGQTRAGRGGALIAGSSPPQRARLRLGLQQFHLHDNSPIRFMAMSSSAFTGSPLRSLSEASIPAIAFSRHCSSRENHPRPTAATKVPRLATQKPQGPHACASPSRKSQRACSAKLFPVKTWTSQARPRLRPINSNFVQNCRFPVILGHFD